MRCTAPATADLPVIDDALLGALGARGFDPRVVDDRVAARALVLDLVTGAGLVSHGGSTTIEELGLDTALAHAPGVTYGNAAWLAQDDPARRLATRKQNSIFADAYLGSVQAIARTGQVVGADAGGSRQGPYVWGPPRVIWVAGANKIVEDREAAIRRVFDVALPLEDARMRAEGHSGSQVSKLVIYEREPIAGRTTLVLVREALGF
jgi:YkgG family uncharacterized protein